MQRLRIATRKSDLAIAQSNIVASELKAFFPNLEIELIPLTTKGDEQLNSSLNKVGGKGLFIKELEVALANTKADIAVHSMKDMETMLSPSFTIAAVLPRENVADAFISNSYKSIDLLPKGSRVGTSSLRRTMQLRAYRKDLKIKLLRGNVLSRLKKLDQGEFDAIVLAFSGMKRLGLEKRVSQLLPLDEFLPAIAQGAIAIEVMRDRQDLINLVKVLCHTPSNLAVTAERSCGKLLGSNCSLPIAALAQFNDENYSSKLHFRGWLANPISGKEVAVELFGNVLNAQQAQFLGEEAAEQLKRKGGNDILKAIANN